MSSLPPPSPVAAPGPESTGASDGSMGTPVDVDRIAQDLADVEIALERLDEGTYWTCEVTGETLPDDLLAADPVARRRLAPAGSEPTGSAPPTSASPETATAT